LQVRGGKRTRWRCIELAHSDKWRDTGDLDMLQRRVPHLKGRRSARQLSGDRCYLVAAELKANGPQLDQSARCLTHHPQQVDPALRVGWPCLFDKNVEFVEGDDVSNPGQDPARRRPEDAPRSRGGSSRWACLLPPSIHVRQRWPPVASREVTPAEIATRESSGPRCVASECDSPGTRQAGHDTGLPRSVTRAGALHGRGGVEDVEHSAGGGKITWWGRGPPAGL
jgi:hypothetical protein